MRTRIMLLALTALAVAVPAAAQPQLFDFLGQADVPAGVGGALTMHSVMRDPSPAASTPIPLDFGTYEYTVVITGLTMDTDGATQVYSGGAIAIYEDAGTAADFANASTFMDGTAILTGVVTILERTMFTSTLGTANGFVDWTGGTRLNDIAPEDQTDWPVLSGISAAASDVEPGYSEQWDGKVEPQDIIVDTVDMSWGELKAQLR